MPPLTPSHAKSGGQQSYMAPLLAGIQRAEEAAEEFGHEAKEEVIAVVHGVEESASTVVHVVEESVFKAVENAEKRVEESESWFFRDGLTKRLEALEKHVEEVEERDRESRLWLKVAYAFIIFLVVKVLLFYPSSPSSTSPVYDARLEQMQTQIAGLVKLWSKPEFDLLNDKYVQYDSELKKYSKEVHIMRNVYQNVTDIQSRLAAIEKEIIEVRKLKDATLSDVGEVRKSLDEVRTTQKTMNSSLVKFNKLSSDVSADLHASAVKLGAVVSETKHMGVQFKHLNSSAVQALDFIATRLQQSIEELHASEMKVAAVAAAAKHVGDEANRTAQSAVASIAGVGFVLQNGRTCPPGSSKCTLWHWMSPQFKEPYCGDAADHDHDWSAGSCGPNAASGELENKIFGCCRDD